MNYAEKEIKLCREIAEAMGPDEADRLFGCEPILPLEDCLDELENWWGGTGAVELKGKVLCWTCEYKAGFDRGDRYEYRRVCKHDGSTALEAALRCLLEILKAEKKGGRG